MKDKIFISSILAFIFIATNITIVDAKTLRDNKSNYKTEISYNLDNTNDKKHQINNENSIQSKGQNNNISINNKKNLVDENSNSNNNSDIDTNKNENNSKDKNKIEDEDKNNQSEQKTPIPINEGWSNDNNKSYYKNGKRVIGWNKIDGRWYYFNNEGNMHKGWMQDNGTWYYLDNNGVMQTGWLSDGRYWYYLQSSGAMATGWVLDNDIWYYLNSSGQMQTGWLELGSTWYYLQSNGAMVTGWLSNGGYWYYLQSSGVMATDWLLENNTWYYLNSSGQMQTGWLSNSGYWYYLQSNGAMATGWLNNGGHWYYLQSNGSMAIGWILDHNKWYYLYNNGIMVYDDIINGWYVNGSGVCSNNKIINTINYGTSGYGRSLDAYKIGSGSKSLIAVFEVHGYEDAWSRDGEELVNMANQLIYDLGLKFGRNGNVNNWSVYIIPSANPDGIIDGWTNNGPGRTTVKNGIDINRSFPTGFKPLYDSRNYTGSTSLGTPEARYLYNFITSTNNQSSKSVLLDVHGWLNKTIGSAQVGKYFDQQFGFGNTVAYPGGYLITWANSIGIQSSLVELPYPSSSNDIKARDFKGKMLRGIINLMNNM